MLIARLLPRRAVRTTSPWSHMMFLNGLVDGRHAGSGSLGGPADIRAVHLRDFGLHFDGWWPQAITGVVATHDRRSAGVRRPVCSDANLGPRGSPAQEMIEREFSVGVGWLAVLTAVVLAPMFEELVFRGLLQSWLVALLDRSSKRRKRSLVSPPWRSTPCARAKSTHTTGPWTSSFHSTTRSALDRRWLAHRC